MILEKTILTWTTLYYEYFVDNHQKNFMKSSETLNGKSPQKREKVTELALSQYKDFSFSHMFFANLYFKFTDLPKCFLFSHFFLVLHKMKSFCLQSLAEFDESFGETFKLKDFSSNSTKHNRFSVETKVCPICTAFLRLIGFQNSISRSLSFTLLLRNSKFISGLDINHNMKRLFAPLKIIIDRSMMNAFQFIILPPLILQISLNKNNAEKRLLENFAILVIRL